MQITSQVLLNAYAQGIFPMAHSEEGNRIYWYEPDPRTIIPLDSFHISRSLRRTIKKKRFEIRVNTRFYEVMRACAAPAPGREETWISEELIGLYSELHGFGFATSVESYYEGELVGGVYGVDLYGLFAGESMFSRRTDASKVALAYLLTGLKEAGYSLFDVQFMTEHLRRFGAIEISKGEYRDRLEHALALRPESLALAIAEANRK